MSGQTAKRRADRQSKPTLRPDDYVGVVRRVAYHMARRLPACVDVRDLISSGMVGLLDALDKYDPGQNDSFEAYAEIRIRGAILDELRGLDWVPRSIRQKGHRLDRAAHDLEGRLGRLPTDEEVARELRIGLADYQGMIQDVCSTTLVSLEDLLSSASDSGVSALSSTDDNPFDQLCRRALASAVASAIEKLPERERLVLSLYYLEALKLKEIGEILRVTESRVCQIHGQAIERLRGFLGAG